MSQLHSRRRSRVVATAGAMLAASAAVAVAPTPAHAAALTGTLTVTTPTNAKLAALTAKQVVVLTVSGTTAPTLSEDSVASVKLGGDANCAAITSYVVTSPTVLTVKTPTGGCAATSGSTAEDVTINFATGDTLTKTAGITFVTAPKIVLASGTVKPVVTDNSANLAYAGQVTKFNSNGSQYVRVKADPTYAFDPRTAAALTVTLGGKIGSEVKVYAGGSGSLALGTAMTSANTTDAMVTGTSPTEGGNYLVFKTSAGMDPTNNVLTIAQNGVSKGFTKGVNGTVGSTVSDIVTGPTVTSVSPNSGPSKGGTSVIVTAAGLTKTWTAGTDYDVYFCGIAATGDVINSAGTTITVTTPEVDNLAAGLGTGDYSGVCPVQIQTPGGGSPTYTSPVNPASYFAFLSE